MTDREKIMFGRAVIANQEVLLNEVYKIQEELEEYMVKVREEWDSYDKTDQYLAAKKIEDYVNHAEAIHADISFLTDKYNELCR